MPDTPVDDLKHYDIPRHDQTCELYYHASCGAKDTLIHDASLADLNQK